jgi:hypothetical protein
MERIIRHPLKVMIIITMASVLGMAGIVGVFLTRYPVFNPFHNLYRPLLGYSNGTVYISPQNFTILDGERIVDVFQFSSANRESIVFFSTQVIDIEQKGILHIRFNGMDIGSPYVETPGIVQARIASCCYVSLIKIGADNVVEFTSEGFEGSFRYVIALPAWGGSQ